MRVKRSSDTEAGCFDGRFFLSFSPSGLLRPCIGVWCEGSLFWNAVSPLTDPPTGGHSGGAWHDLPVLVFLVFRWWSTRKRVPTRGVDAKGTASVALTPPIRAISILLFIIITSVKSTCLPGVASERGSRTALPSSSWDLCCSLLGLHRHLLVPVRLSSRLAGLPM